MRPPPLIALLILLTVSWASSSRFASRANAFGQGNEPAVRLPNNADSFKFAVLGDSGTGDKAQYELADQMAALHDRFEYDTVILLGDNIQGRERPQDFVNKFELPYKRLLGKGVKFYATLGHEDSREQRFYKLFNMRGRIHYTFSLRPDVQFFVLESTYLTSAQLEWVEKELTASQSAWRIAVLHHPLYSSGRRHGSDLTLRKALEPLFVKYNVSAVFSAHDNFYERIKPQNGISYFVVGSGGKLRQDDIDRSSGLTANGFDTDLAFLAAEIDGGRMFFNVISRTGQTVDSGELTRSE
jgi:hypothetical protein